MTNNEKIQRAEQLIAEANALLNEVKDNSSNEEDVIAKYKNDYNKGKQYYFALNGNIDYIVAAESNVFEKQLNPYSNYLTEELAAQAKKLKDFNDKLLAFKYCYDLDYKPDFSGDYDNRAYFVYYDSEDDEYKYCYDNINSRNIIYFSTKGIAQKCADWLNSLNE